MSSSCCDRRRFLHTSTLAAGAAAGSAVLLTGCSESGATSETAQEAPAPDAPWIDVLALDELPVGSSSEATAGDKRILLHRSAQDEVQAFSAVCTHQGCAVGAEPERFACPCHGSVFNLSTGAAEGGPAREPLARYPAEVREGQVRVQV